MTLITEVMRRPLDPGYAAAAAAKHAGSHAHRRPVVVAATLVLALLCGAVSASAVRELRRPQPEAIRARASLEREIERRTAVADRLQASNEALRSKLAQAQQEALSRGGSAALVKMGNELGVLTGELAVSGPGLVLTLDDATSVTDKGADGSQTTATDEMGRVRDADLQIVVNGLWAAGAEAISINGERLTVLSAIRSAGQAILVDYRPLVPPYIVQVIGDVSSLQSVFDVETAGVYLQELASKYGIRASTEVKKSLTLPGAGALALHYARKAGATPSGTSSASGSGAAAVSSPPPVSTGASGAHGVGVDVSSEVSK